MNLKVSPEGEGFTPIVETIILDQTDLKGMGLETASEPYLIGSIIKVDLSRFALRELSIVRRFPKALS